MVAVPMQGDQLRTRRRSTSAPHAAVWSSPVIEVDFGAKDLSLVRAAVSTHALACGLDPGRLEDVVLVAHELCGNAVMHGGGTGRLRLWRSGARLVCQVSDAGPGMSDTHVLEGELPSPRSPGGRGLWLARQFAAVQIATGPCGTTVTAEILLM